MTSDIATTPVLLNFNGVEIVDTFAEAFPIKCARLIITAVNAKWAETAATVLCGNATRDRKSTRLNSSHVALSRMPSSA